jgi:hypothetical protein
MSGSAYVGDREPAVDVRRWLETAVAAVGAPPAAVRDLVLSHVAPPWPPELGRTDES